MRSSFPNFKFTRDCFNNKYVELFNSLTRETTVICGVGYMTTERKTFLSDYRDIPCYK